MARPTKYRVEFCEQAEYVCQQFGAVDEQLAKVLGITPSTLYDWKREHPEFSEAISRGKAAYDEREVDSSVLAMAKGYWYQEEVYDGENQVIVRLWKFRHPDIKAAALFKANRSGWRLPAPARPADQSPGLLPAGRVVGNAEPPSMAGDDLAGLDDAARERLQQVAIDILETRYGTTIVHVESEEVHHGDTEDTEKKGQEDG